jgi:hypothetical protein
MSARVRSLPKPEYIPSMTGSKYSYAVIQLESQSVLNPNAHMFVQEDYYQAESDVAIMTQLLLKAGLKEWGEKAFTSAQFEMKQVHCRDTFRPKHSREMTHTQRQTALESHMFIKEERDGKIKGRTVAFGSKQRDYIFKEDDSSPTIATESVLVSCIIGCQIAHDCTMVASLLYYRKLVKSLTDIVFVRNPFDSCVANKTVEGEQMTICFHVDDCKLSHRKRKVMDRMIEYLRQESERIFEDRSGAMTVGRGKVHKYLGTTLDTPSVAKLRSVCSTTSTRS